jgi:hypothetical protein
LNRLIKKGWEPFGYNDFTKATVEENENVPWKKVIHLWTDLWIDTESLIRIICMKESQLWQFVCENKLLAKWILDLPDILWKRDSLACMRTDLRKSCYPHDYEYRIIESALCDEDKLEDFLLSNIKVDVGNRW